MATLIELPEIASEGPKEKGPSKLPKNYLELPEKGPSRYKKGWVLTHPRVERYTISASAPRPL